MAKTELENFVEQAELANVELENLKRYLMSEKFFNDTTVQVADVMARLPRHIHI